MRIGYGNGGWVRLDGVGLPGAVYARFGEHTDGSWRLYELYLDGAGEPLPTDAIRPLSASRLASVALHPEGGLKSRVTIPGPDLRRLAGHYASTWGSPAHDGQACETCGGPLKGGSARRRKGAQAAMQNWVAEAWFAQFRESAVKQAPAAAERRRVDLDDEEFPVIAPPGNRITQEFLEAVAQVYWLAVAKGLHPAPTIAAIAHVSPKTARNWVAKARKQGVMPPGHQGRVG